jgi:hypothetical protein
MKNSTKKLLEGKGWKGLGLGRKGVRGGGDEVAPGRNRKKRLERGVKAEAKNWLREKGKKDS